MSKLAALILTALVLFPSVLHAEEPDAQTRYHEAYVLEVIEGKVAEAAKVYIVLMGDEDAPTAVRHESRFRFAICTVLLGRADEARAQLGELLADTSISKALRTRVEEYRSSIGELGVGSELDRKLQALVFDLGRVEPTTSRPPAYRDFEIIGKAAIPFLQKLLQHSDRKLRQHAFRLLCRLDDPGVIDLWTPDLNVRFGAGGTDFAAYRRRDAKRHAAFEQRVLELGDPAIDAVVRMQVSSRFSIAFLKKLAALGKWSAAALVRPWGDEAEVRWALLYDWSRSDDEALAHHATLQIIERGAHEDAGAGETEFKRFMRWVLARLQLDEPGLPTAGFEGWANSWARLAGTETVFELVGEALHVANLETVDTARRNQAMNMVIGFMAVLHERDVSHVDQGAVAEVVRAQIAWAAKHNNKQGRVHPWSALLSQVRRLLAHLPIEDAEALVAEIFSGPAQEASVFGHWIAILKEVRGERGTRLVLAGLRHAFPEQSVNLSAYLPGRRGNATDVSAIRALHASLPGLAEDVEPWQLEPILKRAVELLLWLPEQESAEAWRKLLVWGDTLDPDRAPRVRRAALGGKAPAQLLAERLLPQLDKHWSELGPETQSEAVDRACGIATSRGRVLQTTRRLAAAFVLAHPGQINSRRFPGMVKRTDLFPLERWMPFAPGGLGSHTRMQLPAAQAQAVAAHILSSEESVERRHAEFVRRLGSDPQRAELYGRLLTSSDSTQRALGRKLLWPGLGRPVSQDASAEHLEPSLDIELQAIQPDLHALQELGEMLLRIKPSKKLYPVARHLLQSEDRKHIHAGISISKSLGQEEQIPWIRDHLESLDIGVRNAATKAIESIRALAKLRAETKGADK